MPGLFRRHSNVACFFCQSAVPLPQNPNNFRCPACHCWNRYDSKGEIMSFEPAMQDESLNRRSFARRGECWNALRTLQYSNTCPASPSKDRLPTMYGKGPLLPRLPNEPNAYHQPLGKLFTIYQGASQPCTICSKQSEALLEPTIRPARRHVARIPRVPARALSSRLRNVSAVS